MSKYPPCMMMPQYMREKSAPKHRKEPNLLKEFIKFQEFMDGKKKDEKKPDPPPTGKGMWHWVEEPPAPSKLSVLESMALLLLLSIPVAAIEVYGGSVLLKLASGG